MNYKYQLTYEEVEIQWSHCYNRAEKNFRDTLSRGREEKVIAEYNNEEEVVKAFNEIIANNPTFMPRIIGGIVCEFADIEVWEIVLVSYEGTDDDPEFVNYAGINSYNTFPTEEQFEDYYKERDTEVETDE